MILNAMAQLLGVFVVNWGYITAIQFVVLFRQVLRDFLLQVMYSVQTIVCGVFSTLFLVLTVFLGIASILGKAGGVSITEYSNDHIYPLIAIICMEFAEFLLFLFDYRFKKINQLSKVIFLSVEYEISEEKAIFSVFQKPNQACLQ